jgi:oligopeptide transport system permease protein
MIGMGFSKWRIVWRHLLPNTLVPMLAYATLLVPVLVLEEAFLSFLGFGVQPPYPSLGTLLSDGASAMESAPTMLLSSCGAILLLTVCTNVLASRLASRFAATDVRGGG